MYEREREREREREIDRYIYIYIYRERERESVCMCGSGERWTQGCERRWREGENNGLKKGRQKRGELVFQLFSDDVFYVSVFL